MNNNLFERLREVLKNDQRLIANSTLLRNKIVELTYKEDEKLIQLLLSDNDIKKYFFLSINDIIIFNKDKFVKFINNKQFLPDSYTTFKNKIGLTENDEYIVKKKKISLVWPYKDCVLEGGQADPNEDRKEIFWNEILGSNKIDRLLEPKVLTNFKRIDKDGEGTPNNLKSTDNLLIKGNNLLALHSLKKNYRGKVKLIYIDPPYNTGNDDFRYNDKFNHSTWLTFMKNRLEIAHQLLKKEGAIFISIDKNEIGYLIPLLDEIFGCENRRNIITVKRSAVSGPKVINPGLVNISEYVLIYSKSEKWEDNTVYVETDIDRRYNNFIKNKDDNYKNWEICTVLDALSEKEKVGKYKLKEKLGYNYEKRLRDFILKNADRVIQLAYLDNNSISKDAVKLKKKSSQNPDEVFRLKRDNKKDYYMIRGKIILFYENRLNNIGGKKVPTKPASDIWDDVMPNDLHNEGGVKFRKGKKPEKLLYRIIQMGSNKGDLVLDFFLGSGTTAAVAHKTDRQYIGVEQLDYKNNGPIKRLKNVISGKDDRGVSKQVGWQKGGEFVYCEIAKLNEKFIDKINNSNTNDELIELWHELKEESYLSYKVDSKTIDQNINDFKDLNFNDKKRFLFECLDKNHLYVNLSEIDDVDYNINDKIKELNKKFYGIDL